MAYVTTETVERDFPFVLDYVTPIGSRVQAGVWIQGRGYNHATNNHGDVTIWVHVTKQGVTKSLRGTLKPYGAEERARSPEASRRHPDGVAYIDAGSAALILTAEQQRVLDAELNRVRTETPEGEALARLLAEKAEAQVAENEWRERQHRERGVRVLNVTPSYGTTLCWAVALSPAELAQHGYYPESDVLMRLGGETLDLNDLPLSNPVYDAVRAATRPIGSFPGCDNVAYPITAEQWDALLTEQARVVQAAADAAAQAQAQEEARQAAIFAQARATGQRQVLSTWMDDDDTIPDNSFSAFTRWALPDGTTTVTRTPYH